MKLRTSRPIVINSIVLFAFLSTPLSSQAHPPRTLVRGVGGVHSVRNPAVSKSYHSDGKIVEFDAPGAFERRDHCLRR